MTIPEILRLLKRNLIWFILLPVVAAITVLQLTKNSPQSYKSHTLIYTGLASGYNLVSQGNARSDFTAINNAFDNLIATVQSRETIEEVALHLLAQHISLREADPNIVAEAGYIYAKGSLPTYLLDKLAVSGDKDETFDRLLAFRDSTENNEIKILLRSDNEFYGVKKIMEVLTVKRVKTSDMIEISIETTDPAVAQHTLGFLSDVFIRRYRSLKGAETNDVVAYFEDELSNAFGKLQDSEERLKFFGIENKIINYSEQTKYIAESKTDLQQELYAKRMDCQAAHSALLRLEEDLKDFSILIANNADLQDIRKRLGANNVKIANAEIYGLDAAKRDSLMSVSQGLAALLEKTSKQHVDISYSTNGIKRDKILDSWLSKVIEYEECKASLSVFEQSKIEFDNLYDKFAPLGSKLSRLQREVKINEEQYLDILHGLNTARLNQQNLQKSITLSIIDPPLLPIKPQASGRLRLAVGAALAAFMLVALMIFGQAFFNESVQTPEKAVELTGLEILCAFPSRKTKMLKSEALKEIEQSISRQAISILETNSHSSNKEGSPGKIAIFSNHKSRGKAQVTSLLINELSKYYKRILYIRPENSRRSHFATDNNDLKLLIMNYKIDAKYIKASSWQDLNFKEPWVISDKNFDKIIIELPALEYNAFPLNLISSFDLSLLAISAERGWKNADRHLLNIYKSASENKVKVLLYNVQMEYLQTLHGKIRKKRSILGRAALA